MPYLLKAKTKQRDERILNMKNLKYVNDRGFYVFQQANIKVEINGPINIPHKLVIHNQNTEKKVAWEFELTSGELKELGDLILKAAELSEYKIKKAEDEASLLFELDVPLNYMISHINKTYKSDQKYGEILRDKLFETLNFRRDEDYDNDKKIEWFNQLNNLFENIDTEIKYTNNSGLETILNKTSKIEFEEFDDIYETETEYWERNAEDSGMSLEEFFNSID